MTSPKTYCDVAEFLRDIGWNSPNDAQWGRLMKSIPQLRELVNEVYWTQKIPDRPSEFQDRPVGRRVLAC